jgi:polysaccharide biosynthesis transport protein
MKDFVELRHYGGIILKRWWVVLALLLAALVVGYVLTQQQPRVYEATASVLVGQSIQATNLSNQDFRTSEELAQTYAAIARRQPVLQGTVETLGLDYRWQQLKGMIATSLVPGTQLIEITVRAKTPAEAVLIADEVARQLILISPTTLQNEANSETAVFVNQRLINLQSKIQEGQSRVDELEAIDLATLSNDEVTQLQNDINALENVIADWEQSYAQLLGVTDNNRSANYLAIIESAQIRPRAVSPNVQLNMAVAAVTGLVLGLALVFVMEHLDDTVKTTDDFGESLGVVPLGAIKQMKERDYSKALVTTGDNFAPESEAFRMIRSNIQFLSVEKPNKSLLVTSAVRGEGKSVMVANLGVVMAQAGYKTIVVETDLRAPVLHNIFGLHNAAGLTDLLRHPDESRSVESLVVATHIPDLYILNSGELPPNPSELLGSRRMKQVMTQLSEMADVVIYDSPPAITVTDAAVLAQEVDGVVLVVQVEQTRRELLRQALFNLRQAEANIYGVILNGVPRKQHSYYYQGYDYKRPLDTPETSPTGWRALLGDRSS